VEGASSASRVGPRPLVDEIAFGGDTEVVAELIGNKAIENAAIVWVIELERAAGRNPRDTRYSGAPADIESPPRVIEVKAVGKKSCRGDDLWLEVRQVEEALRDPDFWIYVVENVRQGDPAFFTVKRLGSKRLARLLERAKEQRYYTVPWPVAEYDQPDDDDVTSNGIRRKTAQRNE
jgi:hypothetical protein